ncbi:unnamed protein product [Mytilus coruscus]|uniref:Chromo domain-containing protein n=1 Tax=Mytilus coruscus TaxID=42192 RepID=A0A6J8D3X3_MYTCO|nr:unnamed protein product [Mytilus coruscus]
MMAYRATPATQSTDFSPFFLLFGREMCLPIDISLTPKEHLTQDHRIFLGRILQNLERTRKIASENIEIAQEKNKRQYDKTAQEPEFRPTPRVWLYCTKVPVGKAPKLHRKWVGPYYITLVNRSNHTYRIRNCANNKEVKPTNPPPEHENDEDELDPDEIGQQPNNDRQQQNREQRNGHNNDRQQNRDQQNGDNNNRQQQNREQRNDDNNIRGQRNDDNNDRLQTNRDLTIGDNNNQNQPQNPPVGNTKPSCQDCKRGNCTPFREENIDRLMASNRAVRLINKKAYYLIQSGIIQKWHSVTSVRNHAHNFINYFTTIFEERLLQEKLNYLQEKHQGTLKQEFNSYGQGYKLHQARVDNSGKMKFLLSWMNPNMQPEWLTFDEVPNGCIDTFLKDLTREFESEINPTW